MIKVRLWDRVSTLQHDYLQHHIPCSWWRLCTPPTNRSSGIDLVSRTFSLVVHGGSLLRPEELFSLFVGAILGDLQSNIWFSYSRGSELNFPILDETKDRVGRDVVIAIPANHTWIIIWSKTRAFYNTTQPPIRHNTTSHKIIRVSRHSSAATLGPMSYSQDKGAWFTDDREKDYCKRLDFSITATKIKKRKLKKKRNILGKSRQKKIHAKRIFEKKSLWKKFR